jgi:hypothetical protein
MGMIPIDTDTLTASGDEGEPLASKEPVPEKKKRQVKKRKRKYYKSTYFLNKDGSPSKKRGSKPLPTIRKMRPSKSVTFDPDTVDVVDGQLVSKEKPPKVKRPTGKPVGRTRRVLPYEEAKEALKDECLDSIRSYQKWFNFNMPSILAKFPERAYRDEFKGWKDYLSIPDGRFNAFGGDKQQKYRLYQEAKAWAHTLHLKNYSEWVEYTKREIANGTFPVDIPRHPPTAYQRYWLSWPTWLGTTVSAKLQNVQFLVDKKSQHVLIIGKDNDDPSNVYYVKIINGTSTDVHQHITHYNNDGYCNVQVLYTFDVYNNLVLAKKIIAAFASDNVSDASMIVHNIHQLLWELNCNFDRV